MSITFAVRPSTNLLTGTATEPSVRGLREYDVVYIHTVSNAGGDCSHDGFYDVAVEDRRLTLRRRAPRPLT